MGDEIRISTYVVNKDIHMIRQYPCIGDNISDAVHSYLKNTYSKVIKTEERMFAMALTKLGWIPPKDSPYYALRRRYRQTTP